MVLKIKLELICQTRRGGLVSNIISGPREIEYANAAFGQGIALTPMEMIRALASLSNGGNLVVPPILCKK